jgi:hypothetical protein
VKGFEIINAAVVAAGADDGWRRWPQTQAVIAGLAMIAGERNNMSNRDAIAADADIPPNKVGQLVHSTRRAIDGDLRIRAKRCTFWHGLTYAEALASLERAMQVSPDLDSVGREVDRIRREWVRLVRESPEISRRPTLRRLATDIERNMIDMGSAARSGIGTTLDVKA